MPTDPRPTSECAVIRCSKPAAVTRIMSQPGSILSETVVCTEHDAAMTNGEPWYYNSAEPRGVIYIGADLKAEGVRRLVDMDAGGGNNDRASDIDEPHQRFTITHCGFHGGDDEKLHLVLTRAEALEVAEWLQRWAPPAAPGAE